MTQDQFFNAVKTRLDRGGDVSPASIAKAVIALSPGCGLKREQINAVKQRLLGTLKANKPEHPEIGGASNEETAEHSSDGGAA